LGRPQRKFRQRVELKTAPVEQLGIINVREGFPWKMGRWEFFSLLKFENFVGYRPESE
jgi:hypothetical protein